MEETAAVSSALPRICTALNLSDESPCKEEATSLNGLFCGFHSKQCQGLYKGYKRRNAQLDDLTSNPPTYFRNTKIALDNNGFLDVDSEDELREVSEHLTKRYNLLERVIRARKLHHSRFFALNMDYGHQHFLDSLANQKSIVARAIERVVRRVADVLYQKQKWFDWVRKVQDEDDAHRKKEKERVKQEAILFQRHRKALESRRQKRREKEYQRRQEEFLQRAYEDRKLEEVNYEEWDPIEDVVEDDRDDLVEILRFFLWHSRPKPSPAGDCLVTEKSLGQDSDHEMLQGSKSIHLQKVGAQLGSSQDQEGTDKENHISGSIGHSKKKKRKPRKAKNAPKTNEVEQAAEPTKTAASQTAKETSKLPIDRSNVETRQEMRQRLKEGFEDIKGYHGPAWARTEQSGSRIGSLEDEEIDCLLEDVAEIKNLLFCRLLLTQAKFLPAAYRANSIEEFLSDETVSTTDLRDLCLKMERPSLNDVRDACADLMRGDEPEDDVEEDEQPLKKPSKKSAQIYDPRVFPGDAPNVWHSKREKQLQRQQALRENGGPGASNELQKENSKGPGDYIDFGEIDDNGQFKVKKIRIKICGRHIWNYPSEKSMTRGGWFQFSIIARDSALRNAVELCRSWDELFELSVLADSRYFPSAKWMSSVNDRNNQELLHLGFVTYTRFCDAREFTSHIQTGSRGGGQMRHQSSEIRNFLCGHIKRNDPASRRFIQYLAMETSKVVVLVRDGKTGKIILKPPTEQNWLARYKEGVGRASKREFITTQSVGEKFFEEMDRLRKWSLSFNEYYDVYVWDFEPGQPFWNIESTVMKMLFRAHRFTHPKDLYSVVSPIYRTLTIDTKTQRAREAQSGDLTIYDMIWDERKEMEFPDESWCRPRGLPSEYPFTEADALEETALFSENTNTIGQEVAGSTAYENLGQRMEIGLDFIIEQFIEDAWTDDSALDDETGSEASTDEEWEDGEHSNGHASQNGFALTKQCNSGEVASGNLKKPNESHGASCDMDSPAPLSTEESTQVSSPTIIKAGNHEHVMSKEGVKDSNEDKHAIFDFGSHTIPDSGLSSSTEADRLPGWDKLIVAAKAKWPVAKLFVHQMCTGLSDSQIMQYSQVIKAVVVWALSEAVDSRTHSEEEEDLEKEFRHLVWKERAKEWKKGWHNADLEPGAFENYHQTREMVSKDRKFYHHTGTHLIQMFRILKWLDVSLHEHIRVSRDVSVAVSMISFFFSSAFLRSERGASYKDSMLFKQAERAKVLPDRRRYESNKSMPSEHWKEWDHLMNQNQPADRSHLSRRRAQEVEKVEAQIIPDLYPPYMEKAMRPILARLFKAGILANYYETGTAGVATALREPGRDYDLYIDFRRQGAVTAPGPGLVDPKMPVSAFLQEATVFKMRYPNARFSILRIWSAPHFWPIQIPPIPPELRFGVCFYDCSDRVWTWKFLPKDAYFSDWAMHAQVNDRLQRYQARLEPYVRPKRDLLLVMGKDEDHLQLVTGAVTFAIQTIPWKMEIDLWKSFINVDLKFLLSLDEKWLD